MIHVILPIVAVVVSKVRGDECLFPIFFRSPSESDAGEVKVYAKSNSPRAPDNTSRIALEEGD